MNGFLTEKTGITSTSPSLESRRRSSRALQAFTSAHNASATSLSSSSQFLPERAADSEESFYGDSKGTDPDFYSSRLPDSDKLIPNTPISARSAGVSHRQHMDELVNQSSVGGESLAGFHSLHSSNSSEGTAAAALSAGGTDDSSLFGGKSTQQAAGVGNQADPSGVLPGNVTDYISETMDTQISDTDVYSDAMQSSGGGGIVGDFMASQNNGTFADNQGTPFPGYYNLTNITLVGPLPTGLFSPGGVDSDNITFCDWNLTLCYNFSQTTEYPSGEDSGSVGPHRYWAFLLLIFPMLTVFGNVLVCLSVYRERSLRTITNYFIFSLAVADILVAVLVMPMAVYVEVANGKWQLGDRLCDTWVALDVMGCTASILHLTAISIDRYIAVTRPIQYAKHKNSNRVFIMLILVWLISIAISSPIALGMNYTERRTPEICTFYNATFLIYSSMGSFYIPCVVMVILYWRIFKAIRERARKSKVSKAIHTNHNNYKNVIENKAQTRSSSEVSNIEENGNTKRELSHVPSNSSSKPNLSPKPSSNHVETSFTNYNAKFSGTDTDDPQLHELSRNMEEQEAPKLSGKVSTNQEQCICQVEVVKSPTSDDTENDQVPDHVIANQKLLLSPTSEEEPDVKYDDAQQGYSAPSCVEVESTSKVLSPTYSNKALLSPLPHRKSFSMYKEYKPGKKKTKHSPDGTGNGNSKNGNSGSHKDNQNSSPRKYVTKFNFHLRQSKKKKERSYTSRRERKATKTLAIVLGVFLFCWVPFFTLNIMSAICIRYELYDRPECNLPDYYINFFVWLGYINSFLNPVIYTIFNVEFRKAFKKILTLPGR